VAVKIQVEVLWVVTPFGVVVGHQPSEELSASIFRVKMDAAWSSERWYPTAILNSVTTRNTSTSKQSVSRVRGDFWNIRDYDV
jgi:hypothetical protein